MKIASPCASKFLWWATSPVTSGPERGLVEFGTWNQLPQVTQLRFAGLKLS